MASSCGLGFLIAWWLDSKGEHFRRENKAEALPFFSNIGSEIPQYHILLILFNRSKSLSWSIVKKRQVRVHTSMSAEAKNS